MLTCADTNINDDFKIGSIDLKEDLNAKAFRVINRMA